MPSYTQLNMSKKESNIHGLPYLFKLFSAK